MELDTGAHTPARVLLIGDDARSAVTIAEMLRAAWPTGLLVTQAHDVSDALPELGERGATCVLLLTGVAGSATTPVLRELASAAPDAPLIVVSDGDDGADGLALVQAGAQDHLLRSELTPPGLARAIRYAVERKRAEVGLARRALQDPLTGLPNRMLFADRLGVALDRARRTGLSPAVMFLDVDEFKAINDSLGHAAGDRLLAVLAARFGELLRPMDTVARIGGDEFTFLFEGLSGEAEALAIARRIHESAGRPVALGPDELESVVTVSIGIALVDDSTATLDDAIRDADAAMYRAKGLGGSRAELAHSAPPLRISDERIATAAAAEGGATATFYDGWLDDDDGPELAPVPRRRDEDPNADERAELATAIEAGQLRVHYQPRVSINGATGLVGFEALVRWEHPRRGLIAPADFVGLAERTGLIAPLGDWVVEQALAQVRRWRQSRPGMTISVNLSGGELRDPALVNRLAEAIRRTGADPATLWLEVGEDAVAEDPEAAVRGLRDLRRLGVRLALDDFGHGRSSLRRLRDLPVDMIKLHQDFVSGLGSPADGHKVVGAVVDLGHALGLDVVAEGVETDAQLAQLRDLGCDGAQGFLFSQPVPESDVRELLGA